jgi:hypothetical protein
VGFYEADFRYFLATMDTNIALASLLPPRNLPAVARLARAAETALQRCHIMSGMLLSALPAAVTTQVAEVAHHRLATTALAVKQFRNQHGSPPQALAELAPTPLAAVPEDPFTGAELKYRRTDRGYLIYSVGPDLKDDGGLEESERKHSPDGKSYDLTFIVER